MLIGVAHPDRRGSCMLVGVCGVWYVYITHAQFSDDSD